MSDTGRPTRPENEPMNPNEIPDDVPAQYLSPAARVVRDGDLSVIDDLTKPELVGVLDALVGYEGDDEVDHDARLTADRLSAYARYAAETQVDA